MMVRCSALVIATAMDLRHLAPRAAPFRTERAIGVIGMGMALHDLYEAVHDAEALAALPETIARINPARSAAILHFTPGGEQHLMLISLPPSIVANYLASFVEQDLWIERYTACALFGRSVSMDDYIPREEWIS